MGIYNRYTSQEVFSKANQRFNFFFDYSDAIYINHKTPFIVRCPLHGVFAVTPNKHLNDKNKNSGCYGCGIEILRNKFRSDTQRFVGKAVSKFGAEIYNYDEVVYVRANIKVKIICRKHNKAFWVKPASHLSGNGCPLPECARNIVKTTAQFIEEARENHTILYGDCAYDYSLTNYIDAHTNIKIICPKHGAFSQSPQKHLMGAGCRRCKASNSEKIILNTLLHLFRGAPDISVETSYLINSCKNLKPLPFDFAILRNGCLGGLIEYQGEQHYRPIRWSRKISKGEALDNFNQQKFRDAIKKDYCNLHNIPLLEITYRDMKRGPQKISALLAEFIASSLSGINTAQ